MLRRRRLCQPLVLVAKEANVHLVVFPLEDFGRPVTKAFHLGPDQVVARDLPSQNTQVNTHTDKVCVISCAILPSKIVVLTQG